MQSSYDVLRKQSTTQNLQFHHSIIKDVFAVQGIPAAVAYTSTRGMETTGKYSFVQGLDPDQKYVLEETTLKKQILIPTEAQNKAISLGPFPTSSASSNIRFLLYGNEQQ